MLDNLQKYHIILASNSPRRKDLLSRLGIQFKTRTLLGIDESYPSELEGEAIVNFIAGVKADAYADTMLPDELIITADTIVLTPDGTVMGKPKTAEEAQMMLRKLSGMTHKVMTGFVVQTSKKRVAVSVVTKVTFAPLSEEEIAYYVESCLPFDKAGAYGIQEWIGMVAVEGIEGSYWNVMGLPVHQLYKVLKDF
jgi:septum formation protein